MVVSRATIILPQNTEPHLPRIDNNNDEVFPDASDSSRFWYLPTFSLLQPDPGLGIAASPFSYRFEQVGHTSTGEPGINALHRSCIVYATSKLRHIVPYRALQSDRCLVITT